MPAPAWLGDIMPTLLRPLILLFMAMWHFLMTIIEIIFYERQPRAMLNLTALRYRSFARLWNIEGEAMSTEMPGPLFSLLEACTGTILDIGPGSGDMLSHFQAPLITALYGAEPAPALHPKLVKNAEKNGFKGKFHALVCGGEVESLIPALHEDGILKDGDSAANGLFDEICCVRVLCGVPRPQETIKGLYQLLKPGGRMVVCEHVVNPYKTEGRWIARALQKVYTILGWPFFMGGCELQRDTKKYLQEAGEWKKFDLQYVEPMQTIPFIVGELIKAGDSEDKGVRRKKSQLDRVG